jgi:hypothetical protein|tara:strand:- start:4692 stop:5027 length:336 start_codon:yes stop_codon:yes gene_type:complete
MSKLAVCSGDFYLDWLGNFKCSGNLWNVDEWNLHNGSFTTRIDNIDINISALDSRLTNLEGISNGSIPAFDFSAIDPAIATQMFTAGFLLCAVPWAAFFGIAKLLEAIRTL